MGLHHVAVLNGLAAERCLSIRVERLVGKSLHRPRLVSLLFPVGVEVRADP
jgi:hypothetical protein